MLKVAGSLFVIGATTLYGMKRAAELKEQYIQMEYLRQLICQLQSEMRYARSPLGEIFSHMGRNVREPYRAWLLKMGRRMEERDGSNFAALWETSIGEQLGSSALPKTELQRLKELGGRLGFADIDLQVKTLEFYQMQLSLTMNEMREGMITKIRLCHCLGFMSGMLIVTLLL